MAKAKPAKTGPKQTSSAKPRKPRIKKPAKLPEPFTQEELDESYRAIPAADLEPVELGPSILDRLTDKESEKLAQDFEDWVLADRAGDDEQSQQTKPQAAKPNTAKALRSSEGEAESQPGSLDASQDSTREANAQGSAGNQPRDNDHTSPADTPHVHCANEQKKPIKNTWHDISQSKGMFPGAKHDDYQIAAPDRTTSDPGDDSQEDQRTTQAGPPSQSADAGDVSLSPAVAEQPQPSGPFADMVPTRARPGETRSVCWERARREGRAAGLPKGQGPGTAYEWANLQIDRLFPAAPPPEPEPIPVEEPEPVVVEYPEPAVEPEQVKPEPTPAPIASDALTFTIPDSWPELPDNASLQVEIAWVSANRLRVRSGNGVDLSKAKTPAPSYSALSWLETSILFPSKFADISVKATANQDDEKESVRREKLAIEEIRGLLAEMLE